MPVRRGAVMVGLLISIGLICATGLLVFEWDLRPHNYNLASTVSRRPEGYHQTLREFEEKRRERTT